MKHTTASVRQEALNATMVLKPDDHWGGFGILGVNAVEDCEYLLVCHDYCHMTVLFSGSAAELYFLYETCVNPKCKELYIGVRNPCQQ